MDYVDKIKTDLEKCNQNEKKKIFDLLRNEIVIHKIEKDWNAKAEVILEAIHRSSDLTKRGIRGIIAEASFKFSILDNLPDIKDMTPEGELPYDFLLQYKNDEIKIQVKMQRLKAHRPMTAKEGYRFLSEDKFVVETQKTRGGIDPQTGEDTRPYRFGEFDILAVSMHPSTNDWSNFMYTVADWLIPRDDKKDQLLKFQPVSKVTNDEWADDLYTVLKWFKSDIHKKISK